jgi:hypothetical protein
VSEGKARLAPEHLLDQETLLNLAAQRYHHGRVIAVLVGVKLWPDWIYSWIAK